MAVRGFRFRDGLIQDVLAERLSITQPGFWNLKAGYAVSSVAMAKRLSAVFDIPGFFIATVFIFVRGVPHAKMDD